MHFLGLYTRPALRNFIRREKNYLKGGGWGNDIYPLYYLLAADTRFKIYLFSLSTTYLTFKMPLLSLENARELNDINQ